MAGGEGDSEGCADDVGPLYTVGGSSERHSAVNDSPLILFSLEDARKLVSERDRLRRQYEEVSRKVDALAVLLPDNMREKVFGASPTISPLPLTPHHSQPSAAAAFTPLPAPSLSDAIVEVLDENLEIMGQDQIEEAVWENPDFSDKEKYTPEEIAKALERIARRGQAIKRGMRYCSKKVELGVDGMLPFDGPTLIQVIEKLLRSSDESLEPWEVIEKLKEDPDVGDRVKKRSNGVYAALSRLISRRIAYRDADGGYRIGAK